MTNSTFSRNSGSSGGGTYNGGSATAKNTIVANSSAGGNCYGGVLNGGHNLDSGKSCGFRRLGHSLSNANPHLGSLWNNGGSLRTLALLTGSAAFRRGDAAVCLAAPVGNLEQQGVTRVSGKDTTCDIGSYKAT